jgi:RNA polymerase sigma-70 factor (ECF subfamily)
VSAEEFARELGRRLGASADPVIVALEKCHAADVYLAIAASRGDSNAIRIMEKTCIRDAVRSAARKTSATADQLNEVIQRTCRLMLVDEPPRVAACRNFNGSSTLRRYLTIVATRELVRIIKRARESEPLEEHQLITSLVPASDPVIMMLRHRHRDDVDASFRVALGKLSDRASALLRFKLVRHWSIGQIASFYGKSIPTTHRWIAEARDELAGHVRAEVARRLNIPIVEVDSIVRLVQSQIDLSLGGASPASP